MAIAMAVAAAEAASAVEAAAAAPRRDLPLMLPRRDDARRRSGAGRHLYTKARRLSHAGFFCVTAQLKLSPTVRLN
jgi:hypothetical protein